MAAARRIAAGRERQDLRPDVLLVRLLQPGEQRGLHRPASRHWELIYTLAGHHGLRLNDVELVFDPHSLVVYRSVSERTYPAAQKRPSFKWKALHACFDPGPAWSPPAGLDRIGEHIFRNEVVGAAARQRILDAFGRLLVDAKERVAAGAVSSLAPDRPTARRAEDDAQRELMLVTLREILLVACKGRDRSELDARVRDALESMATDLTAAHTLRSLGEANHLSPSRFAHLFRAQLGVSPVRALRLMRLRQAKLQLLYTDDTVERIAESTGFTSSSHLGREFRRHFGVSPRTYRAQAAF